MWEFSINLNSDNLDCGKYIYHILKQQSLEFGSVVTSYECEGFMTIVVGCEQFDKIRMQYVINDVLVYVIANFFKEKFLSKYINIPLKDEINLIALKKALVSFDKETDIHIIQKNLIVENNIFLESFFDFKLIQLKNKWMELVKLTNDNATFLLCDDTYFELLKFLVDNIEICFEQINIVADENNYKLCDNTFNDIEPQSSKNNDLTLIEKIIGFCPRIINIYSDQTSSPAITFLTKIFESRVRLMPRDLARNANS